MLWHRPQIIVFLLDLIRACHIIFIWRKDVAIIWFSNNFLLFETAMTRSCRRIFLVWGHCRIFASFRVLVVGTFILIFLLENLSLILLDVNILIFFCVPGLITQVYFIWVAESVLENVFSLIEDCLVHLLLNFLFVVTRSLHIALRKVVFADIALNNLILHQFQNPLKFNLLAFPRSTHEFEDDVNYHHLNEYKSNQIYNGFAGEYCWSKCYGTQLKQYHSIEGAKCHISSGQGVRFKF